MRFLDLGPLAVELDGAPRTLGGRRVESVAAALLVRAGAPVPGAVLVDAVWGANPPAGAGGALDSLLWRLRRVLEPGRAARAATLVRRDEQGYRLAVPPDTVDSHVLTAAAATADAATDPADSLRIADDALRRWRGTPYDGVPDTGWLDPVRSRLAEVRVVVAQHRLAALLTTGHPDRAVADLVPLIAEHPYLESLWELRLRALYASGRQQAALAAFHELRRILADELGVEPGPALRRLHEQILAHDPTLVAAAPTPIVATAPRVVEVHLPRRGTRFVGRDAERRDLAARLAANRIVTLVGPGGCGKTRLAVEVADDVCALFPDGVWFVDLSSVDDSDADPADRVAARLAATLGLDPGARRTAFDTLRDVLADRAVLLVLDNCEQVVDGAAATVEALVDVAPAVTVLATSRQPLGVDGETVDTLDPLALPVGDEPAALAASPAVTLFRERVTARGEPVALDGPDGAAIARICVAVDGLPLGIELAAARIGTFTLREIADGLGRDPGSLSRLGRGPSRQQNLHAEVDWSYRLATPEERIAHRRLAVLPRPFTLDAAEAVCGMAPLRRGRALDLVGSPGWRPRPGSATTGSSGPGSPRPRPRSASAPATPTSCSPPAPSAQPPTSSSATARRRRWRRRRRSSPRTRPSATTSPHCRRSDPRHRRRLHRRPRQRTALDRGAPAPRGGAGQPRRRRHAGAARRPSRRGRTPRRRRAHLLGVGSPPAPRRPEVAAHRRDRRAARPATRPVGNLPLRARLAGRGAPRPHRARP